jgi:hypothetical protein
MPGRDLIRRFLTLKTLGVVGTLVLGVVVGALIVRLFFSVEDTKRSGGSVADTPPGEYLYLDTQRVLAYLGQSKGGLTEKEKRVESTVASQSATLKSSLLGDIGASAEHASSVETVVTPAATDRFFTLLIELRRDHGRDGLRHTWLHEVDAAITKKNSIDKVRAKLTRLQEGDFIRISNGNLYLPPYAAVVPKARYAASYLPGGIVQPPRPLYAPITRRERRDVVAYLKRLGPDPSLPFVLPTLSATREDSQVVRFFVPTRYTGLLDNARLLAGTVTVVGKVVYKDPRLPGDPDCGVTRVRCSYFDRQTLATFAPALQKAPNSVLESLDLERADIIRSVRDSVTFDVPVVVVLPVAIYQ